MGSYRISGFKYHLLYCSQSSIIYVLSPVVFNLRSHDDSWCADLYIYICTRSPFIDSHWIHSLIHPQRPPSFFKKREFSQLCRIEHCRGSEREIDYCWLCLWVLDHHEHDHQQKFLDPEKHSVPPAAAVSFVESFAGVAPKRKVVDRKIEEVAEK